MGGNDSDFDPLLLHQLGGESFGLAVDEGAVQSKELLQGRNGLGARGGVGGGVRKIMDAKELIGFTPVNGTIERPALVVFGFQILRLTAYPEVQLVADLQHGIAPGVHIQTLTIHPRQVLVGWIRLL